MNRREVLTAALASMPAVQLQAEMSSETKVLVLAIREGYGASQEDIDEVKREFKSAFDAAGISVEVVIVTGMDVTVI